MSQNTSHHTLSKFQNFAVMIAILRLKCFKSYRGPRAQEIDLCYTQL